jgi:hypothetical protein
MTRPVLQEAAPVFLNVMAQAAETTDVKAYAAHVMRDSSVKRAFANAFQIAPEKAVVTMDVVSRAENATRVLPAIAGFANAFQIALEKAVETMDAVSRVVPARRKRIARAVGNVSPKRPVLLKAHSAPATAISCPMPPSKIVMATTIPCMTYVPKMPRGFSSTQSGEEAAKASPVRRRQSINYLLEKTSRTISSSIRIILVNRSPRAIARTSRTNTV